MNSVSIERPFFSFVVPTYNRAHLILATIDSLLHQAYKGLFEIIVVDDGSTDDTEKVLLERYPNNEISYHKKENAERAAARNRGAQIAKGDYINFFDSDDLALPNHLATAADMVSQKGHPEWFHLNYAWALPNGQRTVDGRSFKGDILNPYLHTGNPLSCNGVFIRTDIIRANPFNEDRKLSASEDYELWLRLSAQFPLYYTNAVTSLILDHEARSVHKINGQKVIERLETFLQYVNANPLLHHYYGPRMKYIRLEAISYMAMRLASLRSYKKQSIQYLINSAAVAPSYIFQKRFFATIKNLVSVWQTS